MNKTSDRLKVLFVASEAYPLVKTGGLGDVCGSLPPALQSLGIEVRLLLPAYREAVARAGRLAQAARLDLPGFGEVGLLEGRLPGTRVRLWLLEHASAYDRPGHPYLGPDGQPWPDNAERFALLGRAAAALALGAAPDGWRPDVLHAHDWQTGLAPVWLAEAPQRPAVVFTVHNLSYQGLFPYETFVMLGLPRQFWSPEALEFYGQLSFIKGGLVFADWITTVSPTYAREIQTPAHGCGLDGLLRHRAARLRGILNGIDTRTWNPARDPHLVSPYTRTRLEGKRANKLALQEELALAPRDPQIPLLGIVSRLVPQKGIDLIISAWPQLAVRPLELVVLGSGEPALEQALVALGARYPERVRVIIGYDERLAHRITAGADIFLMPSRFEPCGLNQMYSQRYGTVPVVHRTGGLNDTVVDASAEALAAGTATGFVFDELSPEALARAVERALALYAEPRRWRGLMLAGMRQDFSWQRSAQEYSALYHEALAARVQHAVTRHAP
jgi:starch synthase